MIRLVSWIISKIKKREYLVDNSIQTFDLFVILLDRLFMVLRALPHRLLFAKTKGFLFLGNHVKIRSHRNIYFEGPAIIEDGCYINGLSKKGMRIGTNFSLGRNSIIECTGVIRDLGEELIIGNNVGIASNAFISVRGKVRIGDDTIFGPGVKIFAENHVFEDLDKPIYLQGATKEGVDIGCDCWIGANTVILDGVKIGNKVVVAAGAVVAKDIPDFSIVGGIPAKVLKMRMNS